MTTRANFFLSVPETPEEIETNVTGSLPDWLNGVLLRNGPGIFEVGPDIFQHWFDGLAIIQGFKFERGKVTFSSKYLRSESYKNSMKANRIVAASFASPAAPNPKKPFLKRYLSYFFKKAHGDNDAINFVRFGDQVWATTESTELNQIDPSSLETLNKLDLHKQAGIISASAHPHYDRDGNVYNVGVSSNAYKFFVISNSDLFKQPNNLDGFSKVKVVASIKPKSRGFFSYYHSFAMTENYIIFLEMPLLMNALKLFKMGLSKSTFIKAFSWKSHRKVIFHVIRRSDWSRVRRVYTADSFFCLHHVNAFERDGCLIIDLISYNNSDVVYSLNLNDLRKNRLGKNRNNFGSLNRYVLPLVNPLNMKSGDNLLKNRKFRTSAAAILKDDGTIHCSRQDISCGKFIEFPTIHYDSVNGTPYRYAYATGRSDRKEFVFNEVFKYDVESGEVKSWKSPSESEFAGEPIFVPSPSGKEEDDGLLLFTVTNPAKLDENRVVLLDAKDLREVASARVPRLIAIGFHGVYLPKTI